MLILGPELPDLEKSLNLTQIIPKTDMDNSENNAIVNIFVLSALSKWYYLSGYPCLFKA